MQTSRHLILVALATLLGAVLRLHALDAQSLWLDEGWSIYMGHLARWEAFKIHEHPPLFYALVGVWMRIDDSDFWLRLLPVFFGVASIPLIYLLGRNLVNAGVGVAAAFFLSALSFHVRMSRDLTMYSLEVFLFIIVLLAVVSLIRSPEGRDRTFAWVRYVAACSVLAWSQAIAPLYVVVAGLALAILWRDFFPEGKWKAWLLAHGIILLVFLPWLGTYLERAMGVVEHFWVARPDALAPWRMIYLFSASSIPAPGQMFSGILPMLAKHLPGPWIWAAPVYAMVAWVIIRGIAVRDKTILAMAVALILPIATIYLVSITLRPIMVPRQMIPTIVPMIILLSMGSVHLLKSSALRVSAVCALGVLLLGSSIYHLRYMQKEQWREAAQFLAANAHPGDRIVYVVYGSAVGSKEGVYEPLSYMMGHYDPAGRLLRNAQIEVSHIIRKCRGDLPDCLEAGLVKPDAGQGDYWFVYSHEKYLPRKEALDQWLDSRFSMHEAQEFIGVLVKRGQLKQAPH